MSIFGTFQQYSCFQPCTSLKKKKNSWDVFISIPGKTYLLYEETDVRQLLGERELAVRGRQELFGKGSFAVIQISLEAHRGTNSDSDFLGDSPDLLPLFCIHILS